MTSRDDDPSAPTTPTAPPSALSRRGLLHAAGATGLVGAGGLLLPPAAAAAEAQELTAEIGTIGFSPVRSLGPKVYDNYVSNGRFKGWGSNRSRRITAGAGGGTQFLGRWIGAPHGITGRPAQYADASPLGPDSCLRLRIRNPGVFYLRQYVPSRLEDLRFKDFTLSTDVGVANIDQYAGTTGPREVQLVWYVNYKYCAAKSRAEQCREPVINTGPDKRDLGEGQRYFFRDRFTAPRVPTHPTWTRPHPLEGFELALVVKVPDHVSLVDLDVRQVRLSRRDDYAAVYAGNR